MCPPQKMSMLMEKDPSLTLYPDLHHLWDFIWVHCHIWEIEMCPFIANHVSVGTVTSPTLRKQKSIVVLLPTASHGLDHMAFHPTPGEYISNLGELGSLCPSWLSPSVPCCWCLDSSSGSPDTYNCLMDRYVALEHIVREPSFLKVAINWCRRCSDAGSGLKWLVKQNCNAYILQRSMTFELMLLCHGKIVCLRSLHSPMTLKHLWSVRL